MPSSRRSSTEASPLEDRDRVNFDVDTPAGGSLSFARPNPPSPSTAPDDSGRAQRRPPIEVGQGRPPIVAPILDSRGLLGAMPEYPVQISKVQAPPLREQTLARDRLLDWLAVKVHSPGGPVIAEAGYGKTTLLADFSRRTRIRDSVVPARPRRSRLGRLHRLPRGRGPRPRAWLRGATDVALLRETAIDCAAAGHRARHVPA